MGWVLLAWTVGEGRAKDGSYSSPLIRKQSSKDAHVRVGGAELDKKLFVGESLVIVII
jgi:hypothetical protein